MKCPKDADNSLLSFGTCREMIIRDGRRYFCTRLKGHKGFHHAHSFGKCFMVWKQTKELLLFEEKLLKKREKSNWYKKECKRQFKLSFTEIKRKRQVIKCVKE